MDHDIRSSPWIVCSASSIGCIRTPGSTIDVHLCIDMPVIIVLKRMDNKIAYSAYYNDSRLEWGDIPLVKVLHDYVKASLLS